MDDIIIVEPTTDEITIIINEYDESSIITDHSKLSNLDYSNSGHTGFASQAALSNYVLKVDGKSLSTNDFNNTYKSKLDGIATGAEVNVNADWNATSGDAQILNKPSLSTVATSGSYNDLLNKPIIPSAPVNADWNSLSGLSQILNKPTLATVATSGSYSDLSNKPTIPTSLSQITPDAANRTITNVATPVNTTDAANKSYVDVNKFSGNYSDLTGKPTLATVATSGDYNDLTNKPDVVLKYRFNTLSSGVSTYTLLLTDINSIIETTNINSVTITVPLNSSVAFDIGTELIIMRYGSGTVQIVGENGVTIDSRNGLSYIGHQYAGVTLIKRSTNEWYLVGDLS